VRLAGTSYSLLDALPGLDLDRCAHDCSFSR